VAGDVQKTCHSSHDAAPYKLGQAWLKVVLLQGKYMDMNEDYENDEEDENDEE